MAVEPYQQQYIGENPQSFDSGDPPILDESAFKVPSAKEIENILKKYQRSICPMMYASVVNRIITMQVQVPDGKIDLDAYFKCMLCIGDSCVSYISAENYTGSLETITDDFGIELEAKGICLMASNNNMLVPIYETTGMFTPSGLSIIDFPNEENEAPVARRNAVRAADFLEEE